jgi:hypothetical protein
LKRALKVLVLALGAVLIEVLLVFGISSYFRSPNYELDGHWRVDPTLRAANIAGMLFVAAWGGVGIWQLYKRVPFRFLGWGVAVLTTGIVLYLAIHG